MSPSTVQLSAQDVARYNIIRELVETERKYVQDLDLLQKYANSVKQSKLLDEPTINILFSNFLVGLEGTLELPWQEQRWGRHFVQAEQEFSVYAPYCANYNNISDISHLISEHEQTLVVFNHLIHPTGELPACLVKPVCLLKASSAANYEHYDELKLGLAAVVRVTDRVNETMRRDENTETVKSLETRDTFGELVLDGIFIVSKSCVEREYHVFLFERMILCCPEDAPSPRNQWKRRRSPLVLKGRIFLDNVMQVEVDTMPTTGTIPTKYLLTVWWWESDDVLGSFILVCRREDQVRHWQTQFVRLIRECTERRAAERTRRRAGSHAGRESSAFDSEEDNDTLGGELISIKE
ncbi:Dbl homology domain-containing protein [Mycena rosella]|uniref:Dbl homology domain-containing protein n=1 Tax=Mycena rosella TaxID=1033263 RepID=A0AAD7CY37_MYCRO|nr:Dbl homology domain-containing protein [Mycena rosella]